MKGGGGLLLSPPRPSALLRASAALDGSLEKALRHLRAALDVEPLGLSVELVLGHVSCGSGHTVTPFRPTHLPLGGERKLGGCTRGDWCQLAGRRHRRGVLCNARPGVQSVPKTSENGPTEPCGVQVPGQPAILGGKPCPASSLQGSPGAGRTPWRFESSHPHSGELQGEWEHEGVCRPCLVRERCFLELRLRPQRLRAHRCNPCRLNTPEPRRRACRQVHVLLLPGPSGATLSFEGDSDAAASGMVR
jgi:hypothetical protein